PLYLSRSNGTSTHRDTERQVGYRSLPGHKHREALDLGEAHARMETDATLTRAAPGGVLHTVPREDLRVTLLHHDRHRHDERALRRAQELVHPRVEIERLRGAVELTQRGVAQLLAGVL